MPCAVSAAMQGWRFPYISASATLHASLFPLPNHVYRWLRAMDAKRKGVTKKEEREQIAELQAELAKHASDHAHVTETRPRISFDTLY